jgi:NAD(P)-dependent dehydrogenase (short-subunit alcohol dehydrogenase family)
MTDRRPTNVIVVIGAGSIGQAIARRVSAGKHVVLADLHQDNADKAAKTLSDAGFSVSTAKVDVSSRASVQALVKCLFVNNANFSKCDNCCNHKE